MDIKELGPIGAELNDIDLTKLNDDESCLMFSNPTLEYASDEGESESCGIYYEYYRIREYEPEVWYTVSSDSLYLSYPFYMTLSRR